MSHKVLVSVLVASMAFAAGTVAGGINVTLASNTPGAAPIPSILATAGAPGAAYTAEFDSVPAGDYTVTAQAIDDKGGALSAPISGTVTVAPDVVSPPVVPVTVQIDVPTSLSVTVS